MSSWDDNPTPVGANEGKSPIETSAHAHPVPLEWTGKPLAVSPLWTVLDRFQELARAQPEAVAIDDSTRLMTYGELDRCSNLVADELRRQGLKVEESVAVFLPASCEFMAGVLGVLKAGGTYFPVDTDTPTKRLEFLLDDSASRLVLSDEAGIERLRGWSGTKLDLAKVIRPSSTPPNQYPGVPSDPGRRAYITYTSGSTGQPKGAEIEHRALANLVGHYHRRLNLTAQDRASMLAYVAFDASVADIWPLLCVGGTVVIPPRRILMDPGALILWLTEKEITVTFIPTGLAEILFSRPWPDRMKLRFFITGGDRLRLRPPAGLPFIVINGYGPTENTVFSTWSVVAPLDDSGQLPPIGRPLDNTTAYVLDAQLRPVPIGVEGELFLGGRQIARGYLGRPDLTAERFLPDPFADEPSARMYRTGDWARWRADGELDFLERRDGQIQIRGRRVELGEIEAAVFAHGAVRQVCCVPWLDDGMPAGVIAHIVPVGVGEDLSDRLRDYLCARLPDYMVPSKFVLHEGLPFTPQGKLDRASLTALPPTQTTSPRAETEERELEKSLGQLWRSMLPAADGCPEDTTFAALGGDSLLAIKLMLRVEEIIGQPLEVSAFLVKPTFPGLCETIRKRTARDRFEPVLALRRSGTRPPVFCLHGRDGDVGEYFSLMEALGDDQPVFGVRSPVLNDGARLPRSMEEAASEAIHWIRKTWPTGVPTLVGYSWSGLLAFEVARQMATAEEIRPCTVLIGSLAPMRPMNLASRLMHFIRHGPAWFAAALINRRNRWSHLARWREVAEETKHQLGAETQFPSEHWGNSPLSHHFTGLMTKYRPSPKPDISIELLRERDEFIPKPHPLRFHDWQMDRLLPDGGWNRWTLRANHVRWLPGDHRSILKPPAVSALAQAIRDAMDRHFKSHMPSPKQAG